MEKVWYYPDGAKWAHFIWNDAGEFNDTIYQCARAFWYPDGSTHCVENWKNGERHGKCMKLYPDGKLQTLAIYENGKYHNKVGPALLYYHPDGKLWIEQFYINGRQMTKEKWEQSK